MDVLVFVHIIAALISFFIAGCLLGIVFADIREGKFAEQLRRHPLSLRRASGNPILKPGAYPWTAQGVFNPAAILLEGKVRMLYRAVGEDGISRLGYAESEDGVSFASHPQPVYAVPGVRHISDNMRRRMPPITSSGSGQGGAEDPRMVEIDGRLYVTFNLYNGWDSLRTAVVSLSKEEFLAKRFDAWRGPHLLSPEGIVNKNSVLFPEKIGGKFALLHNLHGDTPERVRIAYADNIESFTEGAGFVSPDPSTVPAQRIGWHTRMKSPAAPPIKTDRGWLLLYHAMSEKAPGNYQLGAMLLDHTDPSIVLYRSAFPVLSPDKAYERKGAQGIVYACGAVVKDGTLHVYYGAADRVIGTATAPLSRLVDEVIRSSRYVHVSEVAKEEEPLFTRFSGNPILAPQGDGFESAAVFNPTAIELNGGVYLLYRAMGSTHASSIGLALSLNGTSIDERLHTPAYVPRVAFELPHGGPTHSSGCEDPRIAHLGDRLYLSYVAYDGVNTPAGALSSITLEDFMHRRFDRWSIPTVFTPKGVDDKDFALLPEQVDGKYVLYHRIDNQLCADLLTSLNGSEHITRCIEMLQPRPGLWDEWKVGIAGPPLKVDGGWLLIYHGISHDRVYRLGAALLEADGVTVRARSERPVFEPGASYEKNPPVVFSCGAVVRGDTIYLYYGAADKVVGVATGSLARLLQSLS